MIRRVSGHVRSLALAGAIAVVTAACGAGGGQATGPKTVELTIVAGQTPANGTFNFNGYAKGSLTISVPTGSRVIVHYSNTSALRHSFSVIPYAAAQPDHAEPPVFPGAATRDATSGIAPGAEDTISFVAGKPGKYEFFCGILGHALAGMWDYLIVTSAGAAPGVQPSGAVVLKVR